VDWTGILIGAAIGNLVGGAITFFVSRFFYVRAASDLKQEAQELKQQTQLIMRGLQEGLDIEFNQDEQGNIIGVGIKLRARIGGSSGVSGTPTVRDDADPADQGQRMQDSE
jgi:hypothetical protein